MQKNNHKETETTYDHVIKYTGLFGGVQGVNLLASVVRNKLVSEILGPAGLGLITIYNAAAMFLSNATNLGISFSAVRQVAELYEKGDEAAMKRLVRVVRCWSLLTALLGWLVCCACSPLLSLSFFEDTAHWLPFVLLSPVVALMALSGGELALLKGARKLKEVAVQSVMNSLCAVVLSVPLYYLWGMQAIVASLVLVALATWLTTRYFSVKVFPMEPLWGEGWRLAEGMPMVKLGAAFILAGILGSGVELVIRAYLMRMGSEAEVGLYNAGYMLTVTYASMVFVAMETDFFPRLSAVNHDVERSNEMVNKQIAASVLLVAPLLVAFLVFLPMLVPLLYSDSFLPVIGMAQCAVFSMYMRAVALPVSYLSLAKGRSRVYLFTEAVYDVAVVIMVMVGYHCDGLRGVGVALSVAALFDLLLVWLTCRQLYGFRLYREALKMLALQLPVGGVTWLVTTTLSGWAYGLAGGACVLLSGGISFYILHRETTLLQSLWEKIKRKMKK